MSVLSLKLKILNIKFFVDFKFSYLMPKPLRQFVGLDVDSDDKANNIGPIFQNLMSESL